MSGGHSPSTDRSGTETAPCRSREGPTPGGRVPLTEYGRWPAGVYLLEIRNIVGSYTQVGLHLPIRG